jgi:hypothetical protein
MTFPVTRSVENSNAIHRLAFADVVDPDEAGDLAVGRAVSLPVDQGIPSHVIPLESPQRREAERAASPSRPHHRPGRAALLEKGAA